MEAFKAGTYDFREEFTSKVWATEYDFPAIRDGKVKKEVMPDETPSGTQGFFLNTRREPLKDPRVRKALDLAFDFDWTNRNLFYGLYTRTESYFENSPMKAEGEPSDAERTLLNTLGVPVSDEALGAAYVPPKSDGSGQDRKLAGRSRQAARRGGLDRQERRARQCQGRAAQARDSDLRAGLRAADCALRQESEAARHRRQACAWSIPRSISSGSRDFDFDITTERYTMRNTPGVELRSYFGSAAAKMDGSLNLAGISDPAVDALIERVIARQEPRGARRPRRARSTACSAPAIIGCPTGTSRRTPSPIGTSSRGPK